MNEPNVLPLPDVDGYYVLRDGCRIFPAEDMCKNGHPILGLGKRSAPPTCWIGKWAGHWKDRTPLRGSDDGCDDRCISVFDSPQAVFDAILSGGEGI